MTTGPAAGFKTNLKFWNPNCQISNFKRTPRVLQVSPGAKTECKMTARVPSFDLAEKINRAAQSLGAKLRKTWNLTVFPPVRPNGQRADHEKNFPIFLGFFRGKCCEAIAAFFFGYFARTTSVVVFVGHCRAWHITVKFFFKKHRSLHNIFSRNVWSFQRT